MCYKNNLAVSHKPHVAEMYFFFAVVVVIENGLYVRIAPGIQLFFFFFL